MRVLFDTNVVLDVLLDRQPFVDDAAQLFAKAESSELAGTICATTMTTIHYLMSKALGGKQAIDNVQRLFSLFDVAAVNRAVLETALEANFPDFEDAVIYASALHANADAIVTRNTQDFSKTVLPIYTPQEILKVLAAQQAAC